MSQWQTTPSGGPPADNNVQYRPGLLVRHLMLEFYFLLTTAPNTVQECYHATAEQSELQHRPEIAAPPAP